MAQYPYEDALEAVREGLVAAQDLLRQEIADYPLALPGEKITTHPIPTMLSAAR